MMKRRLSSLVSMLLCLCLLLSACVSLAEAAQQPQAGNATRTIMLYDCGADLETRFGLATWNLYQILESEIPADINVVVLTGGAREWHPEPEYLEGADVVSPHQENQVWLCSGKNADNAVNGHGKMTLLTGLPSEIEHTYLSDPQTLLGFINYAAANYPAEMYDLILWDHGGGPTMGYGVDDRDPDGRTMSVGAIAKTIKASDVKRFDIIDFDACLMSSVEIAATLAECADYLILSPETEPGFGQEYVTVMNALAQDSGMNGFALCKIVVDALVAFYEDEESVGYGMDGTLAVIDTRHFRERLLPLITEMARIMDRELTTVGEHSKLLNFEDELRSQAATYEYTDATLLDLGNLAEHLGMCISEVENTSPTDEFEALRNNYTATTEAIKAVLADQDGSGDEVIYSGATAGMTRPVKTSIAFVRDENGMPRQAETFVPSGLSIFFAPTDATTMDYMVAVDEMCEAVEDEDIRTMLRAVEVTALRYLLLEKSGLTVDTLRADGQQNVYYKSVWDAWTSYRDLDVMEIYKYKEQVGINAEITGMEAADWDIYISKAIDVLNRYSDVDAETWLALLTVQQSSQALNLEKTTVAGVDKTGDGVEDLYRVTLATPLKLVKDVSLSIRFKPNLDESTQEFFEFLGADSSMASICKVTGNPVQDDIVSFLSIGGELDDSVRDLFAAESCAYDLPTSIDRWYEVLDSDGIGHVVAIHNVDLSRAQEIKIPVRIRFVEPQEDGSDWVENGYLVYGDGHFKGFLNENGYSPMIPLDNQAFNGAKIETVVNIPIDLFGILTIDYGYEISDSFTLPLEPSRDRGMKLVMTPIEEIKDLEGIELKPTAVVTDLYGYEYDISDAIQAAREEAAAGKLIYSIEAAEITVEEAVFNRRQQEPKVTVTLNGKELVAEEDYELAARPMLKAGTQEIMVYGIGDYVGYTKALFTILPAVSTVEATETVAVGDLAAQDVTVLTVKTPAHPDNVQFDFAATDEALRGSLHISGDGRSVQLLKGAAAGTYTITVSVVEGAEDTYSNIDGETYVIEVK